MHLFNHYVEILAFVFIKVWTSSALVRTSVFFKSLVRGQVYIFEISPPLIGIFLYNGYCLNNAVDYAKKNNV